MPTVSAHVAVTLAEHVQHVFGVMGNGNAYFLDALERQTGATFTAVRHEAGAVVAADTFQPFEVYALLLLLYAAMTWLVSLSAGALHRRLNRNLG